MQPSKQQRTRGQPIPQGYVPSVSPFFGLLPPELWKRVKDFFVYSVDFLPLAAGAVQAADIAIQADSDYLIVAGVRTVTDTANTTLVAGPVPQLVTITDTGSGRNLQNQAAHIDNLFGTGQLPSYWPFPKLIPAASTLSTTLQNLDGVNDRNVRISYLGFKVFMFS